MLVDFPSIRATLRHLTLVDLAGATIAYRPIHSDDTIRYAAAKAYRPDKIRIRGCP